MKYTKEAVLEMLHKQDIYGYWQFMNIDTEYLNSDDFTVKCLKCGKIYRHHRGVSHILNGKSSQCKCCSNKEKTSARLESIKEFYKNSPMFGCMEVINIDSEFLSKRDCSVRCVKCGNIYKHYNLDKKKPPLRCRVCFEAKSKDEGTKLSRSERYIQENMNKILTSRDGIKVQIVEMQHREHGGYDLVLQNLKTGEKINRTSNAIEGGFTYNLNRNNFMVDAGLEAVNKDGFSVKVLENRKQFCKLLYKDGTVTEFKIAFYENYSKSSYSHPSISSSRKFGRYFNYTLEGVAFRLDDPKDVYYNCKKDGSDEYEILRPCDIEEQGWDTYCDYTIYGKVLDLSNREDIYYKCQKKGSDKIEVLRLCDIKERQGGL